jgi:methionyl-tRNA synthetase
MWQAMLASAGLPFSKQIFIHGFLTLNGQKISKSLGNSIDPVELVKKYGVDPVRYYFLAKVDPFEDSDFTYEKFEECYNADLANGLGNLVSRVAKLAEGFSFILNTSVTEFITEIQTAEGPKSTSYKKYIESFQFDNVLKLLWSDVDVIDSYLNDYIKEKVGNEIPLKVKDIDLYLNNNEPWKLTGEKKQHVLQIAVDAIRYLATQLKPFLPETAEKIEAQFAGPKIESAKALFPRL